jgi:regulator of cell morphogenesis and NO signaling
MDRAIQNQTVGDVAAAYPLATRVFSRYGIDFCCGGGQGLDAACTQAGISVEKLMDEIELESASSPAAADDAAWNGRPLNELIDHILAKHHRPLDTEFPRLEALARKVNSVHGPKDPERFKSILQTYVGLRSELEVHMQKEEQILFPWIRSGRGASAGPPIRVMMMEHESAAASLEELRRLTGDYSVPPEACATWTALWQGLEALDSDLRQHMHLEGNVLFPRALQDD